MRNVQMNKLYVRIETLRMKQNNKAKKNYPRG